MFWFHHTGPFTIEQQIARRRMVETQAASRRQAAALRAEVARLRAQIPPQSGGH